MPQRGRGRASCSGNPANRAAAEKTTEARELNRAAAQSTSSLPEEFFPSRIRQPRTPGPYTESVVTKDTLPELAVGIAQDWVDVVVKALTERGEAHCIHTGGRTGSAVTRALTEAMPASAELTELVAQGKEIHLWWSDERMAPASDPVRNDTELLAAWAGVPVAESVTVHSMVVADQECECASCRSEPEPGPDTVAETTAQAYLEEVWSFLGTRPEFDVALLGIGEDGHVASLFPNHLTLDVQFDVFAVLDSPKPPARRVTLTRAALNRCDHVWFGATGAAKKDAVAASRSERTENCPASMIRGMEETRWYVDPAAAPPE